MPAIKIASRPSRGAKDAVDAAAPHLTTYIHSTVLVQLQHSVLLLRLIIASYYKHPVLRYTNIFLVESLLHVKSTRPSALKSPTATELGPSPEA